MNWPVFAPRPLPPNMSSPPTSKRLKTSVPANTSTLPLAQPPPTFAAPGPFDGTQMVQAPVPPQNPPPNPRKRRPSLQTAPMAAMAPPHLTTNIEGDGSSAVTATPDSGGKKKGRTNTPWTAEEEQRLKTMRDSGSTWSEIAKTFPTRTEGSVKKHWYKDMHYAEFAEDESIALRDAIREYESNKWKFIGQKIGKPAKACEQYAKEHFKNL